MCPWTDRQDCAEFIPTKKKATYKKGKKIEILIHIRTYLYHRLVNRDVATHGKKFGLTIFNFLALISKGYRSRHCFSLINVSFVHLSQKEERREPIIIRANFSK